MRSEPGAEGFLRHQGLILVAAGGAVAEAGILTLLAPGARTVAPQVTALPSVAVYHDLRWLFADGQSWQAFAAVLLAVLLARAALDAALLRLAWPRAGSPPPARRAFWSCLALTALCWVLLSPAVTLTFGAAVLPFSWPLIGALPIMLGVLVAFSHGGTVQAWWRRLPPLRAVGWVLASFAVLSAASAVIAHLDVAGALAIAAVTGVFNARAWHAMAALASAVPARQSSWPLGRALLAVPLAPVAGLLVLALVVGAARLMFTGTIKLVRHPPVAASVSSAVSADAGHARDVASDNSKERVGGVLVVEGWGTWCCDAADGLRAVLADTAPGLVVRQFSYRGLDGRGNPLRSGPGDDDLPLPELGDKIAEQVMALHQATRAPVGVVAESEGTLGVYAMLARHPGLPVGSVALLSPIIAPGQLSFPGAGTGDATVPPAALDELNHLVGTMSPYGSSGAEQLLASVSEYGARYFSGASASASASAGASARAGPGSGGPGQWLAVVPLADALTLPACGIPAGVLVVPAFHGGLLGDPEVLPMVARFIGGQAPGSGDADQAQMRSAAEVIAGAASAWRMPDVSATCGASG